RQDGGGLLTGRRVRPRTRGGGLGSGGRNTGPARIHDRRPRGGGGRRASAASGAAVQDADGRRVPTAVAGSGRPRAAVGGAGGDRVRRGGWCAGASPRDGRTTRVLWCRSTAPGDPRSGPRSRYAGTRA